MMHDGMLGFTSSCDRCGAEVDPGVMHIRWDLNSSASSKTAASVKLNRKSPLNYSQIYMSRLCLSAFKKTATKCIKS